MTGRALAVMAELGADLQPAGWRLTDRGRRGSTTAGPAACWPRTSTGWRSRRRGTPARSRSRSPGRGRWPRPSSGRAATRCSRTSAPGASWRRRWPRGWPPRRRRTPPGAGREPAGGPGRRAGAGRGADRRGADRVRLRPAPHRAPARGLAGARLGARGRSPARAPSPGCTRAPRTPRSTCSGAPAPRGLSVDHAQLSARDHDELAAALEAGQTVALGVVPSTDPAAAPTDGQVTEAVLRWPEMLGLDLDEVGDRLVLTPACGLAGASPDWARTALELVRKAAANL